MKLNYWPKANRLDLIKEVEPPGVAENIGFDLFMTRKPLKISMPLSPRSSKQAVGKGRQA